jgi:hypothetical protein
VPVTSVVAGTPQAMTAGVAQDLFAFAPIVVATSASHPADLASAISGASRAHAPLLLTSAQAGPEARSAATLHTEIGALHPRAVLAVGVARSALAAQLPGIHVVTGTAGLPVTRLPAPLSHVVLLVHHGDSSTATTAAVATAHAAGVQVITVRGYDPRADPAAIAALSAARPQRVLAIGAGFGPVSQLASRVAVAATGVQLPGGGQILFPTHRLVALYGHPGDPALGALGQQDLRASIARARKAARPYRRPHRTNKRPGTPFPAPPHEASSSGGRTSTPRTTPCSAPGRPWREPRNR